MGRLTELDRLLDFMEENIDLAHLNEIEQLHYDAIKYRDVGRLPLTVCTTHDGFSRFPLDIACGDPEKMLYNEMLLSTANSPYDSVRMKDDWPLMVRSNYGAGVIPSLFGCRTHVSENEVPRAEHITLDKAGKILAKGVPDLKQALGGRVLETYRYYHERLKPYPKCSQGIHITQPDMPGTYDILHLIVGNEAFILPYSNPALAREMIEVITDTCIAFRKHIAAYLTDALNGDAVFVGGYLIGGSVLIKADLGTANLSREMYRLYEGEPDKKIMAAFSKEGGGSLHYCGGPKAWYYAEMLHNDLRCVNFGNPEMHDLRIEYAKLKENKIGIVGWGRNQSYRFTRDSVGTGDSGAPVTTA